MARLVASVEGVEIQHVQLQKDRTTLGRRPYNDIVFDNMLVSGEHCVFELQGIADVYITDVGSTNGTYINGQMIKSRRLLRDGDIIAIGNFKIQFLAGSAPEKPSPENQTMAMSLDTLGLPGTSGTMLASLKVLSGTSAGLEVPVVKVVMTIGQPDVAVVAISHRRDGYYVAHMSGNTTPTLNGKPITAQAIALAHNDVLNLAGTEMEFCLRAR